jgi:hypothetical protein
MILLLVLALFSVYLLPRSHGMPEQRLKSQTFTSQAERKHAEFLLRWLEIFLESAQLAATGELLGA